MYPGRRKRIGVVPQERVDYVVRCHRDFAQFLREKDLLGSAYEYLWDEPTPARFENMRAVRELIRQADPQIRCMMAGTLHEELAGRLRERGDAMWWYITSGPELPYASFSRIDPKFDLLGASSPLKKSSWLRPGLLPGLGVGESSANLLIRFRFSALIPDKTPRSRRRSTSSTDC